MKWLSSRLVIVARLLGIVTVLHSSLVLVIYRGLFDIFGIALLAAGVVMIVLSTKVKNGSHDLTRPLFLTFSVICLLQFLRLSPQTIDILLGYDLDLFGLGFRIVFLVNVLAWSVCIAALLRYKNEKKQYLSSLCKQLKPEG
jgi:hypothetical protein